MNPSGATGEDVLTRRELPRLLDARRRDRKSTRLNSSHLVISYAVFCLKKKKKFLHKFAQIAIKVSTTITFPFHNGHELMCVTQTSQHYLRAPAARIDNL